ncbi:tyrosine-type recombinase/integrase [Nocardia sp. NPDC050713]|uniref:tyrosine-type recombinase/integrase n=1 Tax=Nocardia sp. NPDC050713 TaxID=3154511 RepID=UPI0033D06EA9
MTTNDDISTALHLLSRLGLTVKDLQTSPHATDPVPTFRSYIHIVSGRINDSTLRNYRTYWRHLEKHWGDRHLDEPNPAEIEALVETYRKHAAIRANTRDGRSAARMFVSALRHLYRHAERDGFVHPSTNPAAAVRKPPQLASARHALTPQQINQLAQVASTTGNDPQLDALLVRFHIETACRRGGALRLLVADLNIEHCLVRLREKGGTLRWQPISPTLMRHLVQHVHDRGGTTRTDHVFRYRNGRPMGRRRYDTLNQRLRAHLPWAAALQITAHWFRHTTLTFVEREFGIAVARAYAGHTGPGTSSGSRSTLIYVKAGLPEVIEALVTLTGDPHPLSSTDQQPPITPTKATGTTETPPAHAPG